MGEVVSPYPAPALDHPLQLSDPLLLGGVVSFALEGTGYAGFACDASGA